MWVVVINPSQPMSGQVGELSDQRSLLTSTLKMEIVRNQFQ